MRTAVFLFFATVLGGCGTVTGAVQGLETDFFRIIDFGAEKIL